MSIINSQPLIGASGNQSTAYNLTRSLRFRSSASAYLNRTPASAGNQQKFTLSTWVKRGQLGTFQNILSLPNNSTAFRFTDGNLLGMFFNNGNDGFFGTNAVFRDPSAWYHVVLAIDTTQSTNTNRIKLYVNGVEQTFSSVSYPSQNYNTAFNTAVLHRIGQYQSSDYLDGYLAEYNLIDGQQLDASSFGETDTATGVWKPKKYTGTYGTNGFYLKFDNLTSTSTLGNDSSGNSNTWTVNNISLTSGATYDSMKDVPTLTDADTANYAVMNPLSATSGTFSRANLRYVGPSSTRRANATIPVSTGKWYWEVNIGNAPFSPRDNTTHYNSFGFGLSTTFASSTGIPSVTDAVIFADSGFYKNFSGSFTDGGSAIANGDVLSIAVDLDANTYTFYKNNSQLVTGTIGGTAGRELVPVILSYNGDFGVMDANFGQRPFAYTPPSGFKALNTFNLPTPTIGATASSQANKYFDVATYAGDGTSTRTITTSPNFTPDLYWLKNRTDGFSHLLYDRLRGAGENADLSSNTTAVEGDNNTNSTFGFVSAFTSNGITVEKGSNSVGYTNTSGHNYVAWQWNGGGSSATNTAGSITSTVSANTTAGFSIVTYSGSGSAGTVGHGLGVAPSLVIVKSRVTGSGGSGYWMVYHSATGNTKYLLLNSTDAAATSSGVWNNTTPTSSVFSIGTSGDVSGSGGTFVAYCFAEVAGYSKFGSYTGNGSTDGPFIYLGFRPKFLLIKSSSVSATSWLLLDSSRNTFNIVNSYLIADGSGAEGTYAGWDFLSNGFKIRNTAANGSGETVIYAAFAENPFKYSLAR